jgi:ABC-2 type transport system permease protein
MSAASVVLSQTKFSLRSLSRNKQAVIFTIIFPIILYVLFSSIFGGSDTTEVPDAGKLELNAYFAAGMIAYALTGASFTTLAITLTTYRESGLLKRYRGTPVPSWTFITSLILRSLVLVALMVVALGLVAHFAYDVDFGGAAVGGLVVYLVLGTFTFCCLGVALTTVTSSTEAASAIAPFSVVILSFISGVFIPVSELPDWLVEVGKVFPLAHLATGLQTVLAPSTDDWGLNGENIAILAGWGIAALIVAARFFRWEPKLARG